MDAVKFLREKNRMCEHFTDMCINCPLSDYNNGTKLPCKYFISEKSEQAVEIVEKWSKEHPIMTNAMKYEETMRTIFGIEQRITYDDCPPNRVYCSCPSEETECSECRKWWNEEYKAPDQEGKVEECV